jgi:hypothetical protein
MEKTKKNLKRDFDEERKKRADYRYLNLILVTHDRIF